MRSSLKYLMVGVAGLCGTAGMASANSIQLANESISTISATQFQYQFDVILTLNNGLQPGSHLISDPSTSPPDIWSGQTVPDGIYFDNAVNGLDTSSLTFTATGNFAITPNVSLTPSMVVSAITLQYTGTVGYGPTAGNPEKLGTFSFVSSLDARVLNEFVQYSDFDNAGKGTNNPEFIIAPKGVQNPLTTPLPASAGAGLVGLGMLSLASGKLRRKAVC